jgi:hypothetical protein
MSMQLGNSHRNWNLIMSGQILGLLLRADMRKLAILLLVLAIGGPSFAADMALKASARCYSFELDWFLRWRKCRWRMG